ncbi:MAG: hypothetical protein IPM66_23670 [Acidobacteriota bacterium]|nr:MAG: hypothetical protein IPM66_23670 [Acidobacteriota bacterium]
MNKKLKLPRYLILVLPAAAICLTAFTAAFTAADVLGVRQAREVLQKMAGANLKSDQVRIKNISSGIGGGGVIVEAQIETAFRLVQEKKDWKVVEVRLGDRQWESFELIEEAIRREKERRTTALLKQLEEGLRAYHSDRGVYVDADYIGALLDYLSPRYLAAPVRFDLWGEQFEFKGKIDRFRLASRGADRRSGTDDDLIIEHRNDSTD